MAERVIPTTEAEAATPRRAATIVLLRDAAGSSEDEPTEVLMLRRHARSGFAARAWVFPGGVVDATDADLPDRSWRGIEPESLTDTFGVGAREVLGLHVAAVRETFEEAGVMLATHRDGTAVDTRAQALSDWRAAANVRGVTADWAAFLDEHDLVLDLGAVTPFSRWITPLAEPRRYDTWFFLAHLPPGGVASSDDVETTGSRWVAPLRAIADESFSMIFPTIRTLEQIAEGGSPRQLVETSRARGPLAAVQPHILFDADGEVAEIILPDDDRYPRPADA